MAEGIAVDYMAAGEVAGIEILDTLEGDPMRAYP